MLSVAELIAIARARLKDAQVLYEKKRYDGAVYLAGYAVELALKARICRTLKWSTFPPGQQEFAGFSAFKTHKLEVLLLLSGREAKIKGSHGLAWSEVTDWAPETRYDPIGTVTEAKARHTLDSVRQIVEALR